MYKMQIRQQLLEDDSERIIDFSVKWDINARYFEEYLLS